MSDTTDEKHFLTNKQYDSAKWLTTIVLPACGTLYFAVAQIWGLPAGEQVLGTIIAVQAFLGVLLGISTQQYRNSDARFSGDINITKEPNGEKSAAISFNEHPAELGDKTEATFKVNAQK